MKIKVKADGHNINLWLPNSLLKSRLAYGFIERSATRGLQKEDTQSSNSDLPITRKQLVALYKVLKQCIKANGHFNLVEVESHDGEKVLIRI